MKVIICGAGQVGFYIARYLSSEGHDVSIIDQSPELIAKINDQIDVQAFLGQAAHPDVLKRAGAEEADMLIALTLSDETNMIACQVAHSLFGIAIKIARIRQQSYMMPEWRQLFAPDQLPIDVVISPEIEVAQAIVRQLQVRGAFDIVPMAQGHVRVVGVRCTAETPIINTPLRHLTSLFPDLSITVVAIIRGGHLSVPRPNDQMLDGDEVYFVADVRHLTRSMVAFGYKEDAAHNILILGGGKVGAYLARNILETDSSSSVKILESSASQARKVAELVPEASVLLGDAVDQDLLEEANVDEADAVVAVTDHDEVNILAALLAKRYHVGRVVALINRGSYASLVSALSIDAAVSPRDLTASRILQYIRRGGIRSVYTLRGGLAEVIEAEVMVTSPLAGRPLKDIALPKNVILGAVVRGDTVMMPLPETVLQADDNLVVCASSRAIKSVEKLFAVRLEYF